MEQMAGQAAAAVAAVLELDKTLVLEFQDKVTMVELVQHLHRVMVLVVAAAQMQLEQMGHQQLEVMVVLVQHQASAAVALPMLVVVVVVLFLAQLALAALVEAVQVAKEVQHLRQVQPI
jgi:hypothetical protein